MIDRPVLALFTVSMAVPHGRRTPLCLAIAGHPSRSRSNEFFGKETS
jgi:hypothetical protein